MSDHWFHSLIVQHKSQEARLKLTTILLNQQHQWALTEPLRQPHKPVHRHRNTYSNPMHLTTSETIKTFTLPRPRPSHSTKWTTSHHFSRARVLRKTSTCSEMSSLAFKSGRYRQSKPRVNESCQATSLSVVDVIVRNCSFCKRNLCRRSVRWPTRWRT